jgi:hypothetical protein
VFCLFLAILALAAGPAEAQSQRTMHGIELPNPFGVGITVYDQTQGYEIDRLEVGLPGLDPEVLQDLDVDNHTTSYHLRLDYWLLPFLNVFGLVGQIDGKTTVDLQGIDIGLPVPINDLTVEYEGTAYGLGFVLAGGWKRFFATVEYYYTETDLDVSTSSVEATVIMPTVGYRTEGGALWIGAMYQDAQEHHQGNFELPYVGAVPFDVMLQEAEPWNYMVGATAGLGEHWVMILQGGFGKRDAAQVTLEYRF